MSTRERIQKALATAGVASRREIERLIEEGRISVNGEPATPGQPVGPADRIRVDGRPVTLSAAPEPIRVLLYKKRVDEVVTRDDPDGRRTVFRKLPPLERGRWIAVGRLDINTSGLLLFTNNGELAARLMHPRYEMARTYAVRVHGPINDAVLARLRQGVELDDGPARFETIVSAPGEDGDASNQWYHVTLREGRNRLVRRLIESQDLQVSRLIRLAYGPVVLGRGIKSGGWREATDDERDALLAAVQLVSEAPAAKARGARRPANVDDAGRSKRVKAPAKSSGRASTARGAREPVRERGSSTSRGQTTRKPADARSTRPGGGAKSAAGRRKPPGPGKR